jgi:hypothetical protein
MANGTRSRVGRAVRQSAVVALIAGVAVSVSAYGRQSLPALPKSAQAAAPLLGSISSAVPGLSQSQAMLGAGSLLGVAKNSMPSKAFSEIEKAIPGGKSLLDEAVKLGLPKGAKGLSGLTDFLGKSGISPAQLNQMVPVLTNAVSGKVPADVASAFASALK